MGPEQPLPLPAEFDNVDTYVASLLQFSTSSWLLQTLCGGVHVLDFYTRTPDLYSTILPQPWRDWFKHRDIMDVLDLLMREDLTQFDDQTSTWRNGPSPPKDLVQYIKDVRKHLLARDFPSSGSAPQPEKTALSRHITMGMKVKKVHEVDNFARYLNQLTSDIETSGKAPITHLVDFGSGQNYLGRALAAQPYSKHIVAVESRPHNIEGAKNMDVLAKLVEKPLVMRNKKEYRALTGKGKKKKPEAARLSTSPAAIKTEPVGTAHTPTLPDVRTTTIPDTSEKAPNVHTNTSVAVNCDSGECNVEHSQPSDKQNSPEREGTVQRDSKGSFVKESKPSTTNLQIYSEGHGSVQYVEHIIKDGDLRPVIDQVLDSSLVSEENTTSTSTTTEMPSDLTKVPKPTKVNAMVMSLHSCGNLVHYGLRSLLLSPEISSVAMVGCCYNLVTERLGPPTYKLPTLRPNHPRLEATANAFDPQGFPMSEKLAEYPIPQPPTLSAPSPDVATESTGAKGLRLNITARMMAVQAPFNWGRADSETFFSRHFFRALLQRIFLDRGIVSAPVDASNFPDPVSANGHTSHVNWTPPNGRGPGLSSDGTSTPLTIGTLRKFAYGDFVSYVRAAEAKLTAPNSFCEVDPNFIKSKMDGLTDDDIRDYEARFYERKKELSVMWSLMAFSAGVVEAVIVTDRWLWLKEQSVVEHAWVEPVFEYKHSPRNLVIVGIKK
ncbi:methyltransferase domain-containing protein [Boeremia exigua]|uniref:methyltransferase domain-containing protein n=1 Tax=Boeremia exigua TaxID=749465 RepID=UPI001E8E71FA|nr:methyltransferase domain-containing protein [Boeremia exigua]KAH6638892.1 methyltransferase domain-containing protein [Boeremia exigua]